jgi:type IV pilus assembly protein PilB
MTENRMRLGDTLVEAGVITAKELDRALAIQKERQLRLGTILLQEGFVTESQLIQALSLKLSIPWVSLWRIDIPDELLELVPVNVAEEFFLMPIYVRTTGSGERALYVAMNDPTDEDALRFVAANAGIPVRPMIAGPSDIASAIRFYYYDEDVDERFSSAPPPPPSAHPPPPPAKAGAAPPPPPKKVGGKPSKPPPPPPKAARKDQPPAEEEIEALSDDDLELEPEEETSREAPQETPPETVAEEPERAEEETPQEAEQETAPEPAETASEPADEAPAPSSADEADEPAAASEPDSDDSAAVEDAESDEQKVFADKTSAQREAERRLFGVGQSKPKRSFSLTLLDGTTLAFGPSKKKAGASLTPGKIAREDLLAALKAAANGTPIDDFLPADRWEAFVGALLSVLFRKHLLMFDELMDELKKFGKDE